MAWRTLLLGGGSQLGHDILRCWPAGTVQPLSHRECDVTDAEAVRAAITAHAPHLVVNAAASHRVDDLESDPAPGLAVNAQGAWVVARETARAGAALLWISTDYVFGGDRARPYLESDPPAPVNVYGATKAAGEMLVPLANPRSYIVRTSGLYGVAGASGKGGNFVETMLRLARAGRPIRVVDDQVLAPTSTADLAHALYSLSQTEAYGITHITNSGALSWHDFAARIFARCRVPAALAPVSSAEYGAPAARPTYSVLDNRRLQALGVAPMSAIDDALGRYLREQGHLG